VASRRKVGGLEKKTVFQEDAKAKLRHGTGLWKSARNLRHCFKMKPLKLAKQQGRICEEDRGDPLNGEGGPPERGPPERKC